MTVNLTLTLNSAIPPYKKKKYSQYSVGNIRHGNRCLFSVTEKSFKEFNKKLIDLNNSREYKNNLSL